MKKEISVLVKMGNRCSNNDWRQLMFSVGINAQGPWIASNFCSKQSSGKCKYKGFIFQARESMSCL